MRNVLADCGTAARGARAVDVRQLPAADVREFVLGLQRHADEILLIQARALQHAQDFGLYAGTGARSMADWLSKAAGASYGETLGKVKLANTLERSTELCAAVDAGEVSLATAAVLADAIAKPPAGADVAELVEMVKGGDPKNASISPGRSCLGPRKTG